MNTALHVPEQTYLKCGEMVFFNQLGIKIEMDGIEPAEYYAWLDDMRDAIGGMVRGAVIAEKANARTTPPLNIAIYYDTPDYRILPTGALLRTSCNIVTHAFCAFKMQQDRHGVRNDHRYVFDGEEKLIIQRAPDSEEAVAIVRRLLSRSDIDHPGTFLERAHGIRATELLPAIRLEDYRYTFFVWLDDGNDALRCSFDRFTVSDLRIPPAERRRAALSEVELAIYPRIAPEVASDSRVVDLIRVLGQSLCGRFRVPGTDRIKYQRAAQALGLWPCKGAGEPERVAAGVRTTQSSSNEYKAFWSSETKAA